MPGWSMFSKPLNYIKGIASKTAASPQMARVISEFNQGGRMAAGTYGRAAAAGAVGGAVYGGVSDDHTALGGAMAGATLGLGSRFAMNKAGFRVHPPLSLPR